MLSSDMASFDFASLTLRLSNAQDEREKGSPKPFVLSVAER